MTAATAEFDLTRAITVRSPFEEYAGTSAKVKFTDGEGQMKGLAQDCEPEERLERERQIQWFQANGYELHQRPGGASNAKANSPDSSKAAGDEAKGSPAGAAAS